ncbi:MAG: RnfABCDGE type electron transport complex subunit D [Patescibacteria group bacterium]
MPESGIVISPAPHLHAPVSTERIMGVVILALLPAAAAGIYFFGWRALLIILVSMAAAVAAEALCCLAARRPVAVRDGSAALTGLLLALIIPPDTPLWITVIGSVFAIAIGKQIFGGLGYNPLNPALLGRAFLVAAYAAPMTTWRWPANALSWAGGNIDAVATATPLGLLKSGALAKLGEIPLWQLFLGNRAGSLGETSVLALLAGGLFLVLIRVVDWRIPLFYLGSVAAMALLFGQDPLFHLMTGGLVIGAFFMATDYVTSPLTGRGRIIFGLGCGLLTMLIRRYGGYPEGVCYAILIMNAFVPLIDRSTMPRRFGEVKARA